MGSALTSAKTEDVNGPSGWLVEIEIGKCSRAGPQNYTHQESAVNVFTDRRSRLCVAIPFDEEAPLPQFVKVRGEVIEDCFVNRRTECCIVVNFRQLLTPVVLLKVSLDGGLSAMNDVQVARTGARRR